ncbi:uncharacterized protein IL334_001210 [Kwoniella shivajii]|uniref:Major facilitator superfamily (MFS) profile domain-containing protein n=1 Tax=Kwoniella shivajii TaxID=564305 RepID=A0ABZ1CSX1_9TREE|nr:hypothetical protein IL334_001210 [Kwoniella shivajii]
MSEERQPLLGVKDESKLSFNKVGLSSSHFWLLPPTWRLGWALLTIFTPSMEFLIAARALAGMGGGGLSTGEFRDKGRADLQLGALL